MAEDIRVERDLLQALVRLMMYWSAASTQATFADRAGVDLDPTDMQALYTLGALGSAQPSRIADEMHLTRPTTSKLIARLHCAGLVEKKKDTCDGRVTVVKLSPQGADVFARLVQVGEEAVRASLADWNPKEARELCESMSRFVSDLGVSEISGK